jgi:hypothetical protein
MSEPLITINVRQSQPKATWSIQGVGSGEMVEDNSDILSSREVQQEVLDILDARKGKL